MKSTVKTLALGAALLCLLAGGMALPASAAAPLTGTAVSLPWNLSLIHISGRRLAATKAPVGLWLCRRRCQGPPQPLCTQAPVRNGLLSVTFSIFSTCKQAAL